MSGRPCASVVVPTRNRAHLLPRLVGCLAASEGVDAFEVVIVDDCSTDDTSEVLERLAASSTLELRVHRTAHAAGAAAARNVGWRIASSPLIAFTDDDCRPDRQWLAHLLAGFASADVVQGRTTSDATEGFGGGPFSQVVRVESFSGQFETSNVGYRREVLEALDGFDELFGGDSFGEDVDLAWRAIERGARTAFIADAVVVHDVKRSSGWSEFVASVRDARRWRHIGRVLKDHPGYRPYRLHRGPFLAPTHAPTLLALIGVVGLLVRGRVRGLSLLLLAPWVVHRLVKEPRPGRRRTQLAALPATFVVDAVETATVTMSGIRHRIFVL
jgi:glycosyltransferase involved in cell wall biosynthesis